MPFKLKIAGLVVIILALFSCTCVYAFDSIETESIRINNIGSRLTVSLMGETGETCSVELMEPSVTLPNVNVTLADFMDGLAHIDNFEFDENGTYSFTYVAKTTGIFTLRVGGANSVEFTVEDDSPELVKSQNIYAEAWETTGADYGENYSYRYIVSRSDLKSLGVVNVAKKVKAHLDTLEPGKRTIFIANDLDPKKHSESIVWWDDATEETSLLLGEFFKAYYNMGGNLDFIYSDFESNVSIWNLTEEQIEEITSEERYSSDLKPLLIEAGYQTSHDILLGELKSILKFTMSDNYLYFNKVLANMASAYHRRAIYEPAAKWFKNIKYSDYGSSDVKQYYGAMDGSHRVYIGGDSKKAGTHSVPILYRDVTRGSYYVDLYELADEINGGDAAAITQLVDTDFGELMGSIGKLRISALSTKNGKVTPYVSGTDEDFFASGYFAEQILHVGLHDPDPILYFGARLSSSEADEMVNTRRNALLAALDELNSIVGYADRVSLNSELPEYTADYCISGMYANGRNIWRITPDTSVVSYGDFLVSSEVPTFKAGDVIITFPGGEIIPNTNSTIGYWVATESGVTPQITRTDTAVPEVKLEFIGDDAVAFYRSLSDGNYNLYMASYDAEGYFIGVEVRPFEVLSGNGAVAVTDIAKPVGTAARKFLLWNSLTPIISAEVK